MRGIIILGIALLISGIQLIQAQQTTGTIKGTIVDEEAEITLPFATVVVEGTDPLIGRTANVNGAFVIENIPVGRYNIRVSYTGYEPAVYSEVLVGSGKEVVLEVKLKESIAKLDEVVIKHEVKKDQPLNSMATVSARQLSVEEASRWAGGFDDPARMASSFAGVASNVGNNGIVIRGNAPRSLLWRLEGVEIPNPNHFADILSFGAGGITALSSQMLANSDFFTGAFPSEYGNALSGVFDIKMRNGNNDKREHTFSVGSIGIDFASEGPFVKNRPPSYLFNYRYSTLALLTPLLPENAEGTSYQDLAFKLNFPTKKAGTFSFWGLGAFDTSGKKVEKDTSKWEYATDVQEIDSRQFMGVTGISHRIFLSPKVRWHSSLSLTGNGIISETDQLDNSLVLQSYEYINSYTWKYSFATYLHTKTGPKHANRTGIILNNLNYDISLKNAALPGEALNELVSEQGNSSLMQFYTQSKLNLPHQLTVNVGIHSQYFTLNNHSTLEPRLGASWGFLPGQQLSLAYGLHSRLERLSIYLMKQQTGDRILYPNKDLDFLKAHHLVFGYSTMLGKNTNLKVETYYQWLFDIPVEDTGSYSLINLDNDWFVDRELQSEGTGYNRGIDFTLERYMSNGFYYLTTLSLFESKYKGGDAIERNTRYNKGLVVNLLGGKEWYIGRSNQNVFGISGKYTFQKGDRISPVDEEATHFARQVIYDESRAFENRKPDAHILSVTIHFRRNKEKYSGIWSVQLLNLLQQSDFFGYKYNLRHQTIDVDEDVLMIPSISYKIEF